MNLTKFICALPKWLGGGHLRGKQSGIDILCPDGAIKRTYQCSRCHTSWTRKISTKAKEKTA